MFPALIPLPGRDFTLFNSQFHCILFAVLFDGFRTSCVINAVHFDRSLLVFKLNLPGKEANFRISFKVTARIC